MDFDKDWTFPGPVRGSNGDWPLPPEGVLMSAIANEDSTSSSEGSADTTRIFEARRDTLAKLEGKRAIY